MREVNQFLINCYASDWKQEKDVLSYADSDVFASSKRSILYPTIFIQLRKCPGDLFSFGLDSIE